MLRGTPEAEIKRAVREIGGFIFEEVTMPSGLFLSKHYHQMACIGLTFRGSVVETFGSRPIECRPGPVLVRPPGEAHTDRVPGADSKVILLHLPQSWVTHVAEYGKILAEPTLHAQGHLTQIMKNVYREAHRNDTATELAIQSLAFEIAAHLVRKKDSEKQGFVPLWLVRVKEKLDTCFAENIRLGELAADVGVHPVHLSRAFRRHYSLGMGDYLRSRRVRAAEREIAKGEVPLCDIALRAGFSSQSHFCAVFKQITGETPSEFRRKC